LATLNASTRKSSFRRSATRNVLPTATLKAISRGPRMLPMAASALAARSLGANGIRTRILEDVSRFCNGNFHDDASLIVVTVD